MPNQQQREFIFQKLQYSPSPEQGKIHQSPARIRLVAGGERGGKSYSAANDLLTRFYEGTLYWLVAADYERTRAEYDYICDGLDKIGWEFNFTKQVDPGLIELAGGIKIATKSAKDPRKLAMQAPDGILACEASQLDYETYLRLRGRLAEKRGWMLMSGTFETSLGWYPELYTSGLVPTDNFASFSLPTWSNLAIFPGGRQDPEILALERSSSKDWFLERFAGVPCPPKGRVFHEFSNAYHTGLGGKYEYDPTELVYIWIDPGYATVYSVLAAQKHGEEVYIVDEVYEQGLITSDVIKICRQKPWWNQIIGGAVDIAAKQHQAMPAPAEVWAQEGGITLRSRKVLIRDGIERVKSMLTVNPITQQPLLHINAEKCKGLVSEMGGCPDPITGQTKVYKWKTDRENNVVGEAPEDRHNHSCKALAYGLVDLCGYSAAMENRKRAKVKFI